MNSRELLALLRNQAASIVMNDEVRPAADRLPIEYEPGSREYVSECMRRYNYEAYLEIISPETIVAAAGIDNEAVAELDSLLDAYMDAYAPNRPNLKKYIKLVSMYLAFVAGRPLHPPGLMGGVAAEGGRSCGAGKADLDERFPICRYCVACSKCVLKQ